MGLQTSKKRRTLILINIIVSCTATSLLSTALTTAITPISKEMGITVNTAQWMTSGFSLALGIVTPLTAFLIHRFKTKRLYILGIAVCLAGLFVSMFAPSFSVMMTGRILQACGNGILLSLAQVVILSIFPENEKGTAMGWYGLAVSAAPVVAPTIGGILIDVMSWRAIFGLSAVIMAAALIMSCIVFADVLETYEQKFDIASFAVSIFAFGGITLGIGNVSSIGIANIQTWLPLAVGIAAAAFFVYLQIKREVPFLNVKILKVKQYAVSVIGSMILYLVTMGSSVIMPLYVQSVMGYSATVSGLVTLPGSLASALFSPFAGKIYDRIGIKNLFLTGSVCMFLSCLGMSFLTLNTPLFVAALLNIVRCISITCLMMPLVTWGTSYVKPNLVADATALLTSLRTVAGAIGSAVFVGLMTTIETNSALSYGESAGIHGMNMVYLMMSCFGVILFLIGTFLVKSKKSEATDKELR